MDKHTVSFRLDTDKVEALDSLADAMDRDRSYLLNEAVRAYLDLQRWQAEQIKIGIRQADAGDVISHEEVEKMVAKWAKR